MGESFGGSLEATLFDRLLQSLQRLTKQADSMDGKELNQTWEDIYGYFRKIVQNASDYIAHFDPEGLQMAQRLATRYPESVRLWRYTVEDYQESISTVELDEQRLGKLSTIVCEELLPVVQAIAVAGCAGYQEALVTTMIEDIVGWQDKDCVLANKVSMNYFY